MKRLIVAMIALSAFALTGAPAAAQQTTGNIQGRITDAQKAAVPGVTVTAKSASTGFTRAEVTNAEGVYRLNALPVGAYDLHAELSGFAPYDRKDVIVNIGATVAQRPSVRESRGDDSGRRPRLPQRPDQEHAVLAANQRRERPQPELPD